MIRLVDSSAARTAYEVPYSVAKDKLSQEEQDRIYGRLPRVFWVKDISISKHRCHQLAALWEKQGKVKRLYTPGSVKVYYEKVINA